MPRSPAAPPALRLPPAALRLKEGWTVSSALRPLHAVARREFAARFAPASARDPRTAPARFVWDLWHDPGRYRHLRAPAASALGAETHARLSAALTGFGRELLGCGGISPLWTSAYIDGHEQRLHADLPHGPIAFVWSLCARGYRFHGGETQLLRPAALRYWETLARRDPGRGWEPGDLVARVAPVPGRLTLFDGRVPHGVTPVSGARDLLEARVVVHGWFRDARPRSEGPLGKAELARAVRALGERLRPHPEAPTGLLTLRSERGGRLRVLFDGREGAVGEPRRRQVDAAMAGWWRDLPKSAAWKASRVTLPVVFA